MVVRGEEELWFGVEDVFVIQCILDVVVELVCDGGCAIEVLV